MNLAVFALLAVLAPGAPDGPRASHPALPWLHNLSDVEAVDADDRMATVELDEYADLDPSCASFAYPALALRADVARVAGTETVLASFSHGTVVKDREGQVIASAPGYPCEGTADELTVLAAGRAFGDPTIVLAVTTGGHREQLTWLGLFRVGYHGRLEAVFAGVVEEREDGVVRTGTITILPGAILHRTPDGDTEFWVFDREGGIYVPRGSIAREPHV